MTSRFNLTLYVWLGTLLLVFLGVAGSHPVSAQACGEGSYLCEIYTRNGQPAVKDLKYELFAVSASALDSLRRTYSDGNYTNSNNGKSFEQAVYDGMAVLPAVARGLLRPQMRKKQPQTVGLAFQDNSAYTQRFSAPRTGLVMQGKLWFHTYETGWQPYFIKLTSSRSTFYLLCNPFGGCHRKTVILWEEDGYPQLADERR